MRLLLERDDDQGRRAAGAERRARREAQIRAHMDGHLCRCGTYPRIMTAIQMASAMMAGADAMTEILSNESLPLSRRDLLKGGALVVGFSIVGVRVAGRRRARRRRRSARSRHGRLRGSRSTPTTPRRSISARCELGQGNTTGLLQIAAEELDLDMSQLRSVRLDTNITPNQGATSSSSSIHRGGAANARGGRGGAAGAAGAAVDAARRADRQPRRCRKGVVSVDGRAAAAPSNTATLLGDKPFNVKFTGRCAAEADQTGTSSSARACRASISRRR